MRIVFIKFLMYLCCAIDPRSVKAAADQKNVVLLIADDAGFEMGSYGNHICQTPNLDALAKKSCIYNNAFTSVSSCSPSRAQLLTGLPSHQNGMYGLHQGVHHFNVFDSITSLPNVLRSKNIYTGIIGKKHIGRNEIFKFDFEQTEENHSINQIGRNITVIKNYVRQFIGRSKEEGKPFFLVVGFHDPHRCGHITPQYGEFCERWGSGEEGMGKIPDWTPIYYDWRNLPFPEYLPQTDQVRQELAAQYMTISRLDQGVGLVLKEIVAAGFEDDTHVIYTSDNGPPFPGGRTNMYDYGTRVPLLIHSPEKGHMVDYNMTSLMDIYQLVLNYFDIKTEPTGESLLKSENTHDDSSAIFGSHNFHEVTMNYPMRMIRTPRYKLIHNLNYQAYFPIDQDFYTSPTFQEILNLTLAKTPIPWIKTLKQYYVRPEWEMYDTKMDPLERWNLAEKSSYRDTRRNLEKRLREWQIQTNDPWQCAPHGVLESQGVYKSNPSCFSLGHNNLG